MVNIDPALMSYAFSAVLGVFVLGLSAGAIYRLISNPDD